MKKVLLGIGVLSLMLYGCATVPKAILPIPAKKQVDWQKMETYAFIHFGPNTFLDREWGYGDADPKSFNPTDLDCEQWVRTLKAAGMKGVILTAKHHDGFCLWPSKYTDYSVKQSPWKNGKGDVVQELSQACKKYGLKFAVYLSPWDRNHSEYGKDEYVKYFHNQLQELLSNYGPVYEVWFDGANGGDGWYGGAKDVRKIDHKNYYNYPKLHQIVDSLQPQAIIFADGGPGCRWVGNEKGFAGQTNWSFLKSGSIFPGSDKRKELNEGNENGDIWVPAECDVSIRPGWFYHKNQDDHVRGVDNLMNLYYSSVGRNGTLLLNFPVDRRGKIPAIDSVIATKWRAELNKEFKHNVLQGAKVEASSTRGSKFRAKNVLDTNFDSYWATKNGVTTGSLTFYLPNPTSINRLLLQEYIPLGQRVKAFNVEMLQNGVWVPIKINEETTTIGYKRILRFNTITTTGLKINFTSSRGPLVINNIEAFNVSDPMEASKKVDYQLGGYPYKVENTIETLSAAMYDNNSTTDYSTTIKELIFNLKEPRLVHSFTYLPIQAEPAEGLIDKYELYASSQDGSETKLLASGEFSNIKNNPIAQTISFTPITTQYIVLKIIRTVDNTPFIRFAEVVIK